MGHEDLVNDERRQLLALLLEEKGLGIPQKQEMTPREKVGDVPLSFAQQRLWFLDQLEEGSPFYNLAAAVRLQGVLNVAALEQSLQQIVQRHEALRTTFPFVSGRPVQCISTHLQAEVPVVDIAALSGKEREEQVQQMVQAESLSPFDLAHGPLLRARLLRREQEEHVLLVTMHHIVSDGWSVGVFLHELSVLYTSYQAGEPPLLPTLPLQYADYALWQREHLQGEVLENQMAYWQEQLAGAPTDLMLPTDWPRPAVLTYRGRLHLFNLPKRLSEELKTLSRQRGVTLFMTLLAAWEVLLCRYSGQDDLLIGTPIANRTRAQLEGLIGCFVNTLVLRGDLSGNPSFLQLLERVREVTLQAYAYQDLPFEQLIEVLQLQRDLSHTPLIQVMFVLQNAPMQGFELPGLHIEPLAIKQTTAKFELTLTLQETTQGLQAVLEYNCDLFEAATITRMAEHYQLLLEGIVADPGQHISRLPLLSTEQQIQVLTLCNPMPLASFQEECLHTLFEAQVQRTPDAVALVFENAHLSYQQLNEQANQIAHQLQAEGVGPEVRVGLCLERSLELLIGLLAILKAGGAYVPLDPAYPAERLAFLLVDAHIQLLLTQERVRVQLPSSAVPMLCMDTDGHTPAGQSCPNPESGVRPEHLAYVIYTSGSTGTPKGVMVSHGNVSRLFDATQTHFHFSARDVWTQFHSTAFDFSVWELWGALLHGGRLLLIPYWLSRSPQQFAELLIREQVTVLNQTPSAFRHLLSATETAHWQLHESLRLIIFGGEALDLASVQLWWQRHGEHGPQLVNMYGITETTVHVTAHELAASAISASQRNSIGRGLCDLQLYVLDAHLLPLPPGVPGELYVGGAGLARGYLGQPALTAERFVPHPFSQQPGRRLYKTGDVVRLLADGTLEYLGRNDAQVKVRGFRIELGEIEAALATHEQVRDVVVLALEEGIGNKRLVAYVVPQPQQRPTVSQLRAYLQAKLPDYMLPSSFVMLDELPLTSHGKLDRRALPVPGPIRPELEEAYVPARSPQEEILVGIWSQVLGLEQVGIHDNFFALGGDSIRSIQVLALAQQRGLACSLMQLFRHQTIASLALALSQDTALPATTLASQPLSLLSQDDRARLPEGVVDAYPLTLLQAGMFFHSAYQPERAIYHNVSSLHVQAPFDLPALHTAFQQLIARHPVLRTSFDLTSFQQPLQVVHQHVTVVVPCQDLRHLAPPAQEAVMAQVLAEEKQLPFDWRHAPLLRLQVHRRSQDSFQLTLTEHHAILDGWSVASLLTELFERYLALLQDHDVPALEPPAVTFRDFVALELGILASEEAERFWTQHLADSTSSLVPRDNAGPAQNNEQPTSSAPQSRQIQVPISSELSADLHRLARATAVPLKSVLLAAHLNVVRVLGGQADVLTGLVSNGRPETADGERVLGLFLNTLPYRQQLTGGRWRELVQQTFEHEQALLPWRRYPLAQIQRQQGGQPLFETIFNFIHFHVYERLAQVPQLQVLGGESFARTNFLLVANFSQTLTSGQVQLQLEYDEHQVSSQQMEAIGGYYSRTLAAMSQTPDAPYQHYSLLSEQQQQALLADPAPQALPPQGLPHLFEAQVQRTPDAVALVCEDHLLTYCALNQQANQLAHHLLEIGIGPEKLVGICLPRSLEQVISVLAVLKAGGAYLPLDPAYPSERLTFMLTDARIAVLLTQEQLHPLFQPVLATPLPVVCLQAAAHQISQQPIDNLPCCVLPQQLAYVIYTSGSTGTPKGVMVTQAGLLNYLTWAAQTYQVAQGSGVLLHSSLSFDLTVTSLFTPLLVGQRLVLLPQDQGIERLAAALLQQQDWSLLKVTPAHLDSLRQLLTAEQMAGRIRALVIGGEALDNEQIAGWQQAAPSLRIYNEYGPSETVVGCSSYQVPEVRQNRGAVPIGQPITNMSLYILDAHAQPVPVGVVGEVFIGGLGVGRGYLRRVALTAERFVPHPFSKQAGERLYRTGDLACYLPPRQGHLAEGTIEFVGRIDEQVKLRGYRIELGEIEAVLGQHPHVQDAAVVAREDEPGMKRLAGYLVMRPMKTTLMSEIRTYLKGRLPDYMIPSVFVEIEALPLTPNGKIDRPALPRPERLHVEEQTRYVAPQTPLEQAIAAIWQAVLHIEHVGIDDNFFDLGGHSLLLIQAQERLHTVLEEDISIIDLFDYPTIKALAQHIQQRHPPEAAFQESFERAARRRRTIPRRRQSKQHPGVQGQEGVQDA